ncbi:MAG: Phage protein [Labilithrix sp.]|nr:Phage protein [Labilithrix sp.]
MTSSLLDAFEIVAQAETLKPRIEAALAEVAKNERLVDEKAWVAAGCARLAAACEGTAKDLLTRALRIPELEPLRPEHARTLQGAVVDALEHLQAAISYAGGVRSPLLEALYYKLKIIPLRKADREEFDAFCTDFEKRLGSTYARRMLASADYAPVNGALDKLRAAIATWRSIFVAEPASGEEADALRAELEGTARRVDTAARQARLLAQAALAPLKEVDAATLLALKKKKRGVDDEDTHPLLETDPPDPNEPTGEELADIADRLGTD